MTDLSTNQTIVDIVAAVVVAVLAYGATSVIALRRDKRQGKSDDVALFGQVQIAAAEQMTAMRQDILDMRERLDRSEERANTAQQRADTAFTQLTRLRDKFNIAVDHMERLEQTLRGQGLSVPKRPSAMRDVVHEED